MKTARLTIFFSLLIFLVHSQKIYAQNEWDAVLDRYGAICKKCIELREMISRGEKVPSDKISSLLSEMKTLREKLKDTSASMTPRQRKLYAEIRDSYSLHFGAEKDSSYVEKDEYPILEYPKPLKVGAIISGKRESINAPMPSQPLQKFGKFHFGFSGICSSSSDIQYGAFLSGRINRWGAYISAQSNYTFTNPSYSCNSSGQIEGGGVFWGDGSSKHTVLTFCAGPTYRICRILDIYAGIGYVGKKTFWRDLNGEWAKVTDLCYNSLCGEAGVRFILKGICISTGARFDGGANKIIPQVGLGYEF